MNSNILCFTLVVALSLAPATVRAAEKDPFAPYIEENKTSTSNSAPKVERTYSSNTLDLGNYTFNSYRLVGVIVSPEHKFAVVRGVDNLDYFVNVGDSIGREKGVVQEITVEKVKVNLNNDLVTLTVSNKLSSPEGNNGAKMP